MNLTISLVEPGKRPWASWLGEGRKGRLLESALLGDPSFYEGTARHIVFVHGAREQDRATYESMWQDLGSARNRVWWLFYSGGGYYRVRSEISNIHFLRYEVATSLGQAEIASIRQFLATLEADADPKFPDCWDALYPPDNTSLVALYTILAASRLNIPIDEAIDRLSNGPELLKSYGQYERIVRNLGTQPLKLDDWEEDFRTHRYDRVGDELQRTLGGVPD